MVKFYNEKLGLPFWVAEDRVEEYKGAGFKPASSLNMVKPKADKEEVKEEVKPKSKKSAKNEEDVWLMQK